jgi:CRP-like cAMP-binding protein
LSTDVVLSTPARARSRIDNRLLAALPDTDYALIAPHLREVKLARGQALYEPGDDVHTSYFPCGGAAVTIAVVAPDGRQIQAACVGREGAVGGIVSAGRKPAFGRAEVQTDGAAMTIVTERLEELKCRSPRVADLFARYADVLLAQVMQSVACSSLHSVEQRIARWLLAALDRSGGAPIRLTQEEMAEALGVQRTSVTAAAMRLQSEGAISYRRGRLTVLDRPRLAACACPCHREVERHYACLLPEAEAQA